MSLIFYYVTSHGFGHAVRSGLVIEELRRLGHQVIIKTVAPSFLFRGENGHGAVTPFDTLDRVVQPDSLTVDLPATLAQFTHLLDSLEALAEQEMAFVKEWKPDLIVGDIAPVAVAVANKAGLPSAIVGNFLWDWIVEGYQQSLPDFADIAQSLTDIYRQASLIIRPGLHGGMERYGFLIQDVGLITRRSRLSKLEARSALGIGANEKTALVSLGGMGVEGFLDGVAARTSYTLITLGDRDERRHGVRLYDRRATRHVDLMMAADVVIGKLGYGLCCEVMAAQRPILYTPRHDFVEYRVLADGVKKVVAAREVEPALFFDAPIDPLLDLLVETDPPLDSQADIDGALAAASLIERMG